MYPAEVYLLKSVKKSFLNQSKEKEAKERIKEYRLSSNKCVLFHAVASIRLAYIIQQIGLQHIKKLSNMKNRKKSLATTTLFTVEQNT